MLRSLIVAAMIGIGIFAAVRGPFAALLFYLWIAYFRPEVWVWSDWVISLNLSLLVGGYLVLRTLLSPEHLRWDWRIGLLLAYLVHNSCSVAFSMYGAEIWDQFANFAKSALITYLIACLTTDVSRLRTVFVVIAVSLGAEAAKQGWAGLILSPGSQNNNEIPFLGDNNGVAVGMLMLAPILAVLARTAGTNWEKLAYRFVLVGVIYRALSTYSRGGFIACGALIFMFIVRARNRTMAAIGVVVVGALLIPVLPPHFWDRMTTITAAAEERDWSARGRLYFWEVAITMAADHPMLGVGPFAYNHAYDRYDTSAGEYGGSRSVHSIWFGVLSELGFIGFLLFVAVLTASYIGLVSARALARNRLDSPHLYEYASALEISLIVFLVGGTFLPIQHNEMAWHFIGLAFAVFRMARVADRAITVGTPPAILRVEHAR